MITQIFTKQLIPDTHFQMGTDYFSENLQIHSTRCVLRMHGKDWRIRYTPHSDAIYHIEKSHMPKPYLKVCPIF